MFSFSTWKLGQGQENLIGFLLCPNYEKKIFGKNPNTG